MKALIFDIGGVLLRTEDLEPRRVWERRLGLPDWGLADLVFNNEVAAAATVGKATSADVWAWVQRRLALYERDLHQLQHDFWAGDRFDTRLLTWIAAQRPRYKTAILTNQWTGLRAMHTAHLNATGFDEILYSCEVGLAKPDPAIYRLMLDRLRVAPERALLVDDAWANVDAALAVGLQAVHFTAELGPVEQVEEALAER
jgi:putative hydrolase of the HAD superfamily